MCPANFFFSTHVLVGRPGPAEVCRRLYKLWGLFNYFGGGGGAKPHKVPTQIWTKSA